VVVGSTTDIRHRRDRPPLNTGPPVSDLVVVGSNHVGDSSVGSRENLLATNRNHDDVGRLALALELELPALET
jgi:hypothetical protein